MTMLGGFCKRVLMYNFEFPKLTLLQDKFWPETNVSAWKETMENHKSMPQSNVTMHTDMNITGVHTDMNSTGVDNGAKSSMTYKEETLDPCVGNVPWELPPRSLSKGGCNSNHTLKNCNGL